MNALLANNNNHFFFSGTVGDAYIAFCKLYDYSITTPCSLQRICRIPGSDRIIQDIAKFFPSIKFVQPYIHFDSIEEMRRFAEAKRDRYINIFYDGNGRGNEPDDPKFIKFTPFPSLSLPILKKGEPKFTIGIQLNSGIRNENRKLLDINWVIDVCKLLKNKDIQILILGTEESYNKSQLALLDNNDLNVSVHLNNDISEWMSIFGTLDFLITPEGFPAFWGLSLKVPSVIFYYEVEAILRMHIEWRKIATAIKLPTINGMYYPIDPRHIGSIILTKLLPDIA